MLYVVPRDRSVLARPRAIVRPADVRPATVHAALADATYPGVLEQFLRWMVGDDYYEWDLARMAVLRAVNRDRCAWYESLIGIECYVSLTNVERILTVYMRYVKERRLVGWSWTAPTDQVGGAINAVAIGAAQALAGWPTSDPGIVQAVSAASGVTEEIVQTVLNWLYSLTMRGDIATTRFLRPYTWALTAADRVAEPEFAAPGGIAGVVVKTAGRAVDGLGEVVDAAFDTLSIATRIVPWAALALGAYLVYDVVQTKLK